MQVIFKIRLCICATKLFVGFVIEINRKIQITIANRIEEKALEESEKHQEPRNQVPEEGFENEEGLA